MSIRETTSVVRGGSGRAFLFYLCTTGDSFLFRRGAVVCSARQSARVVRGLLRAFLYLILSYLSIYLSVRMGTGICPSGLLLKLLGFRPLSCVSSCLVRGEHTHTHRMSLFSTPSPPSEAGGRPDFPSPTKRSAQRTHRDGTRCTDYLYLSI